MGERNHPALMDLRELLPISGAVCARLRRRAVARGDCSGRWCRTEPEADRSADRVQPRHQPDRRAPLQRTPGPVADPPSPRNCPRPTSRGSPGSLPRPSPSSPTSSARWPAAQGQPAARPCRPTLGSLLAKSGRSVLVRPQGRAPQRRPLSDQLHRRGAQAAAPGPTPTRRPRASAPSPRNGIAKLLAGIRTSSARRIAGLGIAAPYEMWTWNKMPN